MSVNFQWAFQLKQTKFKSHFVVLNARGLHTRPSTEIVKCLTKFKSDVSLKYRSTKVNGRSLMGILMLAAERGSKIEVTASGDDAEEAVNALVLLAQNQFYIKY